MVTKVCEMCGKEFEANSTPKKNSRRRFCNKTCAMRYITKHRRSYSGTENPFYGKTHTEETKTKNRYAHTGIYNGEKNPFYGKMHTSETKSKCGIAGLKQDPKRFVDFCKRQALARFGENNPNYIDGSSLEKLNVRYCEKFNEPFRRRVRAFFNHRCAECGISEDENGRKMAVHHVNYNKKSCCDNSPRLFVPLCTTCHGKTNGVRNGNREYWEERFKNLINTKYSGKCYYTEEEYKSLIVSGVLKSC